jgi:hypothetical protein
MLTNHQLQLLQNPLLSTQTSQSFSCSAVIPPPLHLLNTTLSITDPIKQLLPTSSSTTIPEPIENTIVPLQTNETNQSVIPSDTTTQPPVN